MSIEYTHSHERKKKRREFNNNNKTGKFNIKKITKKQQWESESEKKLPVNWIQCVNKCNNIIIYGLCVCMSVCIEVLMGFLCVLLCFHYTPFCWEWFFFRWFFCCCWSESEREQERQWLFRIVLSHTHTQQLKWLETYLFIQSVYHFDSAAGFFQPYSFFILRLSFSSANTFFFCCCCCSASLHSIILPRHPLAAAY